MAEVAPVEVEAVVVPTDLPIMDRVDAEAFWSELIDYDAQIRSIFTTDNIIIEALRHFENAQTKTVADLGCGVGNSFQHLHHFQKVYAVDYSENMLEQAKERLESNVDLIHGRIESVQLPHPCDLTLALASVMPESNDHFHVLMENIVRNTASDGTIMLYVPSLESRTFAFQKHVDILVDEGRSQEEIATTIRDDIQRYQFNPLGYMLTDGGLLQKQWLKEEIEYRLARYNFRSITIEKFKLDWDKQIKLPHLSHMPRHWNWFVTIKR